MINKTCLICKKKFKVTPFYKTRKYCSLKCFGIALQKNKIIIKCKVCKKNFEVTLCHKTRKYCSLKCSGEARSLYCNGEKSPLWKGGLSFKYYGLLWTLRLKRSIRERDNNICQLCGKHRKELDKALCVHHIDYVKTNNFYFNLIALCNPCHMITNGNRDKWLIFFQNILKDKHNYSYPLSELKQKTLMR